MENRIETKRRAYQDQVSRYRSLGFDTVLNPVQNLLNRRSLRLKLIRMEISQIAPLPSFPITTFVI